MHTLVVCGTCRDAFTSYMCQLVVYPRDPQVVATTPISHLTLLRMQRAAACMLHFAQHVHVPQHSHTDTHTSHMW